MDYTPEQLRALAITLEHKKGTYLGDEEIGEIFRAYADKIEECERVKRGLSAARAVIRYLVDHSGRHLPKHQAAINAALKETK